MLETGVLSLVGELDPEQPIFFFFLRKKHGEK